MLTIAISGYFNPLHSGHLDYIEQARNLGDKLIAIINNDKQVKLKGSISFMDEKERAEIVMNSIYVDEVFISIDTDLSVSKSLEFLKPDIFANGGDRIAEETPEYETCKKLNIEMVSNIGGSKTQSSSSLLYNINKGAKSNKLLSSFVEYCRQNPNQRFWQALRNWSEYRDICGRKVDSEDFEDTFYKE